MSVKEEEEISIKNNIWLQRMVRKNIKHSAENLFFTKKHVYCNHK